ncbi:MAG: glucoamylase family protein, partial [Kiritimatiellae bacterium]|nr:glucoamylase family protein [Kiritimatiellia bacterium]
MSFIVEHFNLGEVVSNPNVCHLQFDNVRLRDPAGKYPDLDNGDLVNLSDGSLRPEYQAAFLDYVRALSFLYFLDFASRDPRTGGMIQDRSTFADLLTVGGVGFQVTAYVIGAECGYITRSNAANRIVALLRVLENQPQGTNSIGTIGYQGFFYHFLGIDGLRKQNFDFSKTPAVNERMNTVELSLIDPGLALMGILTGRQYFDATNAVETELRARADAIYGRVNWPFMVAALPGGTNQFYLGWKPNEDRDDLNGSFGRFLLNDPATNGQYSSKMVSGAEVPATLDYYTDEDLIDGLLGMGSINPTNRLDRSIWDGLIRAGSPFVKTYPGALFTYEFFSLWVRTDITGTDNHPARPVDFFNNTRQAVLAAQQYAIAAGGLTTAPGTNEWGYSAAEGPYDSYFAESAPPLTLSAYGDNGNAVYEAEYGTGAGVTNSRGHASRAWTRLLTNATDTFSFQMSLLYDSKVQCVTRYSNDGGADTVRIAIDGTNILGSFDTVNTRPESGASGTGWNFFAESPVLASSTVLPAGAHTVSVTLVAGDAYGVEIDMLRITGSRPPDSGTLTAYAMGSAIQHASDEAINGLWHAARLDLNGDGKADLLHPRFGFADAYNMDISHVIPPLFPTGGILRTSGPWMNMCGFAIDNGPMMIAIDNYLRNYRIPQLFMSYPTIHTALTNIFPKLDQPPVSDQLPGVIEFTHVPAWGSAEYLQGRVLDVPPADFRVVVYLRSGNWWPKPYAGSAPTTIAANGTWSCDVVSGGVDQYAAEYAAFLVPAGYEPPAGPGAYDSWPALPYELLQFPHVQSVRQPGTRHISFAGYDWIVKEGGVPLDPGYNYFSAATNAVWVDADGLLHLTIAQRSNRWWCSEVVANTSLGYGTYSFKIDTDLNTLDTNAVLGLFTWDDTAPDFNYREIDVEVSHWGWPGTNGQYVIKPYQTAGNMIRFNVDQPGFTTHEFA